MTQRVIKFRCWEPSTKAMHYNLGYISNGGRAVMGEHRPIIGGILLQFSGLLDKHGKEIYEGDIMALLDASGKTKYLYIVKFEDAKFVLYHSAEQYGKWGDLHRAFDYDFRDYEFCKVGDIYTTPELVDPKMIER